MTLQPGYPKYKGESSGESMVYQYKTQSLPAASEYGTEAAPDNSALKLASIEYETIPGGYLLTKTYKSADSLSLADGSMEIECRSEDLAVPIENHNNYLKNWNHDLHAIKDMPSPGWWATAEAGHVPPTGADGTPDYIWAKPGDTPKEGYALLKSATKPGVESFKAYTPRVTTTRKFASKASCSAHLANNGHLSTPTQTFGFTGEWLQGGSSIKREGGTWTEEIVYIGSREIDKDIYS